MATDSEAKGAPPPEEAGDDGATFENFRSHITAVAPSLFVGATSVGFQAAVAEKEAELKTWAESTMPMMLIRRDYTDEADEKYVFDFEVKPVTSKDRKGAVAFIKGNRPLNANRHMSEQMFIGQINEQTPYQAILNYVRHLFIPYSRSLLRTADEKDDMQVLKAVSARLGELDVELRRSQQTVDIPSITLEPHNEIKTFVEAEMAAGRKPDVEKLPKGHDADFLNTIQKGPNSWKKQILSVTSLNWEVTAGTTMDEIGFWAAMASRLDDIQAQLEKPAIKFTFQVLKENRRFLATAGFQSDAGLENAEKRVQTYQGLLRDFPIKELLSASDITALTIAIEHVFAHLKNIRRNDYPLSRAVQLVYTVSRDVTTQLRSILNSSTLMGLSYDDFNKATKPTTRLIRTWETNLEAFNDMVRDLRRKRQDKSFGTEELHKRHEEFEEFKERVQDVRRIRKEHQELFKAIEDTLATDPRERTMALNSIQKAYEDNLLSADVLDTTASGTDMWKHKLQSYRDGIDDVEKALESTIRTLLEAAKTDANEMFRVCARFNALFFKPRIESAIRQYRDQLLETVKTDITQLQEKFREQYDDSEVSRMSDVRDMPPVSGAMIWAKQIERQLDRYIENVAAVLGPKWHHTVDGKRLKTECDQFRRRLQPKELFQQWLSGVKDLKTFDVEASVFRVVTKGQDTSLEVNFDDSTVQLFKEVRALIRLGQKVPYEIKITAEDARDKYPFAVRLGEVISIYTRTCNRLDEKKELAPLAAVFKKAVQDRIMSGVGLQWDTERLQSYVDKLGSQTVEFQDQVDELMSKYQIIERNLKSLQVIKPTRVALREVMKEMQSVVTHFDNGGFSNLNSWVSTLDQRVEEILVSRLQEIIKNFALALEHNPVSKEAILKRKAEEEADMGMEEKENFTSLLDFVLEKPVKHEIIIRNQVLHVEPPMQMARQKLLEVFQDWLATVLELPRIQRWTRKSGGSDASDTYKNALDNVAAEDLRIVFDKIESLVSDAETYSENWLRFQALWDMDMDMVLNEAGEDLEHWEALMQDMKRSRSTFDNSDASRYFGPLLVEYSTVQTKVNDKYDYWHRNILNKFGQKAGDQLEDLYKTMQKGRKDLEAAALDFSSTKEIVESVTLLQTLNEKCQKFKKAVEVHKGVEKILQRQRYIFPEEWLYVERVAGEFSAFDQILGSKLARMHDASPNIQALLVAEETALGNKMKDFMAEWKEKRPIQGDLDHHVVKTTLEGFRARLNALVEQQEQLNKAKTALEMQVKEDTRLAPVQEELKGLDAVWDELGKRWNELDALKDTRFRDLKPIELRRKLSAIQNDLKGLPNYMRQYGAYDHLMQTIHNVLQMNGPMVDLGSGVLRDKHHKQILKELGIDASWNDLTVGRLWQADLRRYSKTLKYIIEQAQGESALEEFLNEISSIWEHMKLELVDYRQKCFLIRNWDPIFAQLTDHISDLTSMKQSPYFKAFERDANEWEHRLNTAQEIFDIFIDVQRRWVYLEGIFNNSADVQQQLAFQYKRFRSFDSEFVRMMREMKRDPSILYWLQEKQKLQPRLESYAETLDAIQKALGEYLEKQRAAFPRFYFVGDEDLLEIIGNAKNPLKVQRHLPKMFAGLSTLMLSDNGVIIKGMRSKEGEEIPFKEQINVGENPTIHDWLDRVQYQMQFTLASLLEEAVNGMRKMGNGKDFKETEFFNWVDIYPAQVVLMASQVRWSESLDAALKQGSEPEMQSILDQLVLTLKLLADHIVLPNVKTDTRKKYEQLVTEMVHQRDTTRVLIQDGIRSNTDYEWLRQVRFYFNPAAKKVMEKLEIRISRAQFFYGWEYQGVTERLVQTPLTDRAYLTLCEALHMRMGGNPFGPAGTGKTESVKALGALLGRFVLVFNCDETFDFQAMGRILIGLCQCGAWGCFDEFNRLEERILSAVSQQILTIQMGLREHSNQIQLLGRPVNLNSNMGMFVTMNPGYAGRSNLPDNLKQLFRGIAMIAPDRRLIAQVMLYSQGFRTAEDIAGKVVLLFELCKDQLSNQSHYDFGLRALKSVLRSAGNLKRRTLHGDATGEEKKEETKQEEHDDAWWLEKEQQILIESMCETLVPKLVQADTLLFETLLTAVFPTAHVYRPKMDQLRKEVSKLCKEYNLCDQESWVNKVMQLEMIQSIHHGVIMVGPAGTGKTMAWKLLLEAMERIDGKKSESYVLDPKALTKDELYGTLDPTTLEWTNGVFTFILRKIIDNVRGEANKRHWIIFDGDVDPEWAENLNSVLDDNKLLTLPNGERLALTPNIRIMFEAKDLNHATPATVSRCGMVWFSEEVVTNKMIMTNMLLELAAVQPDNVSAGLYNRQKPVQEEYVKVLSAYFNTYSAEETEDSSFVQRSLDYIATKNHVMPFMRLRMLSSLFSLLKGGMVKIFEYNDNPTGGPPLSGDTLASWARKFLVEALLWALAGSLDLNQRLEFCKELHALVPHSIKLPGENGPAILDYEVRLETQEWELWADRIDMVDMEADKIVHPDIVIETVDTRRHADIVGMWVADHRPAILCGPPGSGKSMTLTSVLRALPNFELVTLNFSSSTLPDLIMKTFDHYCKVERTPNGFRLVPNFKNKWLVIFCDEINLPVNDEYETQVVITFLRQMTEQGGFWRSSDLSWIELSRIQIIGACNPPTDAGRVAMTPRFMRHCPLLFVDFPAPDSLKMIYGTFNRALLKLVPALRNNADALTNAMVDFYVKSQKRFTPDQQPHYIYSPRELSRWTRAMYEAMKPLETMTIEELVRLWMHEALRLFQDRLVEPAEREWTDDQINSVAREYFTQADHRVALARPVLYSNWLTKQYISVDQEELRSHVQERLRVFNEEELDVKLVIFDEVLEHILRIDRVLRQPLGHMLLVGASGAGKTILSKFVSWMNGMSVFQIKVHKMYDTDDFDNDLRGCLLRAGTKDEKICFIFDESNVLDTGFLERMNALLASGEVPGLFENADYQNLMQECKEDVRRSGVSMDNEDDLYARFCGKVQRNLHVVFTMNPSNEDFDNRSATSPALFNRCVIDWFGEWSHRALMQVGYEFTKDIDLGDATDQKVEEHKGMSAIPGTQRESVVETLVYVHESVHQAMDALAKQTSGRATYVTPRHYLDFIKHYHTLFREKTEQLEDQQRHLRGGLKQLADTAEQVSSLRGQLEIKKKELERISAEANQKLNQMLVDKKEAEQKRTTSIKIQAEVKEQEEHIQKRRETVQTELAGAEPALREAEASVKGIKKSQLVEVAGFRNPPPLVKLAVEPIVMVLGGKAGDWEGARKVLRKPTFIPDILNFDTDKITDKMRHKIEKNYIANPDYNFEKVNKASKACGPLVKWLSSQLHYSKVLNSVEPLQNEVKELTTKAEEAKNKMEEMETMVKELDERIAQYQTEYEKLISQALEVKNEMQAVEKKVTRSVNMIKSLEVEQVRWEEDANDFQKQMSTVTGDSLVAAAFLAYIGYFNQHFRQMLVNKWIERLKAENVQLKENLSVIEYMSHPSERLRWQADKLPADDLCAENAIMIKRFNRYPLIIDPSGQATEFMMTHYKDQKIIRTSFLDPAFLKYLESALRFGNALLVEDSESMDPVLNSVLNREISKTGGRVMITVGDKEIDFSPAFTIFLATRDPTVHFTPDLCSRVTFVNFTVTHSSLTSQCLSKVLKKEKPEIDRKRTDIIKLQGEYRVRLRHLEESLLTALSSVKGNILEDDKVMNTLETLKKEAQEVGVKMKESEDVMEEVHQVSNLYRPFALACSRVYFTLEKLSGVHFLYQFSLNFFLDIVDNLLEKNANVKAEKDEAKRRLVLSKELFWSSYERVSRGLFIKDQVAFALRLAQLFLEDGDDVLDHSEMEFLMKASAGDVGAADAPEELHLPKSKRMLLTNLFNLPAFSKLQGHLQSNTKQWVRFHNPLNDKATIDENKDKGMDEEDAIFSVIPSGWEEAKSEVVHHFHHLLITKVLRPDLMPSVSKRFVSHVFGKGFLEQAFTMDLKAIVTAQIDAKTPVLLVSAPGYDPSGKVDALAATMGKKMGTDYTSLAMGSPEGYGLADAAVKKAVKTGKWVLLKNVHLAPVWLSKLEKSLHMQTPHKDFRLFLTMEMNLKVPANLVRTSLVIISEAPVGIKASLIRTWGNFDSGRVNRAPRERSRLYFLLAWLHAVVMERLRYVPVGWSKGFEFSESDLNCAVDAIDDWIDMVGKDSQNVRPEKIPWGALQALMDNIVYGGRIDNEFDQARLDAFSSWLFCANAYNLEYPLAQHHAAGGASAALLTIPDANDYAGFQSWINELPDLKNPETLGLAGNAELMLLEAQAQVMCRQLLQLQEDAHTQLDMLGAATGTKGGHTGAVAKMLRRRSSSSMVVAESKDKFERPQWMVTMAGQVKGWLKRLPALLKPLERNAKSVRDPLFRALDREVNLFIDLLHQVRQDLTSTQEVLLGKEKANNTIRKLFQLFQKDTIPPHWQRYKVEKLNITLWIDDFSQRVETMAKIQAAGPGKYGRQAFWLGALQTPEAFVAATRQAVAQDNKWSLDELVLHVSVEGDKNIPRKDTFCFTGFTMFAATWKDEKLALTNDVSSQLPNVYFTWALATEQDKKDAREKKSIVSMPVYLNGYRHDYLFTVRMACPNGLEAQVWAERGACITVWHPHL